MGEKLPPKWEGQQLINQLRLRDEQLIDTDEFIKVIWAYGEFGHNDNDWWELEIGSIYFS